jgi:hypothetical protein
MSQPARRRHGDHEQVDARGPRGEQDAAALPERRPRRRHVVDQQQRSARPGRCERPLHEEAALPAPAPRQSRRVARAPHRAHDRQAGARAEHPRQLGNRLPSALANPDAVRGRRDERVPARIGRHRGTRPRRGHGQSHRVGAEFERVHEPAQPPAKRPSREHQVGAGRVAAQLPHDPLAGKAGLAERCLPQPFTAERAAPRREQIEPLAGEAGRRRAQVHADRGKRGACRNPRRHACRGPRTAPSLRRARRVAAAPGAARWRRPRRSWRD